MRKIPYYIFTILIVALTTLNVGLLSSCSTTSHLPEGETLYDGVKDINFVDHVKKNKRETGVIVAIADAYDKITDALNGKTVMGTNGSALGEDSIVIDEADNAALEKVSEELHAVLEYAPNNSLFGSAYMRTPFPIGLWAYNAWGQKEKGLGHWLFKKIGSEPVTISSVGPDTRSHVAHNVLRNYGFFHNTVSYEIVHNKKNDRKAKITYNIKTGKATLIDSIEYRGFSGYADSLIQRTRKASLLQKGVPFAAPTLVEEQTRIANVLRNQGFYYYQPSFATYKADTVAVKNRAQLRMVLKENIPPRMMQRWHVGRTYITVERDGADTVRNELKMRNATYYYTGDKLPVRPGVFLRNIRPEYPRSGFRVYGSRAKAQRTNAEVKPSNGKVKHLSAKDSIAQARREAYSRERLYRYRDQEKMREAFSDLGIFSHIDIKYMPRDTTATCDTLDLWINTVLDKKYSANLEVNVTERNGDRLGPGLALSIDKRNTFRGAELLSFKLYGSYEWRTNQEKDISNSLFNSYNVGTQLSLDFPRIICPWINTRDLRATSTSISLNADWLNRAEYYNLFSLGLDLKYTWRKNRTSRHELIPFSLTYEKKISSTAAFDSILTVSPALAVSMQDRFVPAIQYTYGYTQPKHLHRNPLTWQLTVKEAGAVTSGIYAIAGQKFSDKDKKLFNNPFAQFIKLTSELHVDFRVHENTHVVTRLFGGVAYSYGNSQVVPFSDQFYVGGANSIRAFPIRSIGPGRFVNPATRYSYMDQTGDFKLEANAELRFPLFGSMSGAAFLDMGNVWLIHGNDEREGGKLKFSHLGTDIAIGTGAGLRYDLDFLVVRLDMGFALHNPSSTRRGYFDTGKFADRFAFHFAIGYPF